MQHFSGLLPKCEDLILFCLNMLQSVFLLVPDQTKKVFSCSFFFVYFFIFFYLYPNENFNSFSSHKCHVRHFLGNKTNLVWELTKYTFPPKLGGHADGRGRGQGCGRGRGRGHSGQSGQPGMSLFMADTESLSINETIICCVTCLILLNW